MQTTRAADRPGRRWGVALGGAVALFGGLITAAPAQAVAGAAFTTNADGERVNQNHYADKCDVYINGGPNNVANQLSDGAYFFSVLSPGGQLDPNDGGADVLYADSRTDRTFTVANGKIDDEQTPYASHPDASTDNPDDRLVQLCRPGDPANYRDTTNPGGVYILALCALGGGYPVTPRDCKYDAFKVAATTPEGGSDLAAIKSAAPSFTRSYTWSVEKSVDKRLVSQLGGTATFNYEVDVTRSGPKDSDFALAGEVTVFNPNDLFARDVTVSDETLGVACVVAGGPRDIAPGTSEVFPYHCDLDEHASARTAETNVATVTWDQQSIASPSRSTTARAAYDFGEATVNTVGASTDVRDTYDGVETLLAQDLAESHSFTYPRTVAVPASNCITRVNTAVVGQSGDADSETVRVCGPNSDGYTIGFWKNNSSKVITWVNAGAYCTAIGRYPAVLTEHGCTAGSNTAANAKAVNTYIARTMADAESSGTGLAMLKAQLLATTLSVQRTPALGATNVLLTTTEAAALGITPACAPVTSVLSAANATHGSLSKADVVLVKDVFDRINNNRQLTC